ncbi:MAG: ATP-dependent acyl-CoA ligase [Hyphomicrobiales bacterium]|nr:ATP-dependent acyl-CoA ligase [Hyphomicrobiales bacterium]
MKGRAFPKLFAPAERNLPAMLAAQAGRFGDKPLVTGSGTTLSFREARELAAGFGGTLLSAGIERGDRVALICGNSLEFVTVMLGAAWIGAVLVPINTGSRGPQLAHILRNCGARLLILEAEFLGSLEHAQVGETALEALWLIGKGEMETAHGLPLLPLPETSAPEPAAAIGPGDTLAILYTSGTTGPSKGVICPHAQYYWWGIITAGMLGVEEGDVLVTPLPLFHSNALNSFYQALLKGAHVVYLPRFSVSGFFASLAEHKATVTYLLGAMVPMLLSRSPSPQEKAHGVRIALAPGVPERFRVDFAARSGIALLDGYGSTETNFVIGARPSVQRPGMMGAVIDGFEARVVDEDDNELPDGEAGELMLRARDPYAFARGYFAMPDKTVEAWRNLWFHTGDRVLRESDGQFRFLDRLKDAIRRRGENISSFEVEQVLISHPAIAAAAVFPVSSELAEDEVMAAVLPKPESGLSELELFAFCEPRLPRFALPRFVEFVAELPRTENGKVQKFKLRERGVGPRTWDREKAGTDDITQMKRK